MSSPSASPSTDSWTPIRSEFEPNNPEGHWTFLSRVLDRIMGQPHQRLSGEGSSNVRTAVYNYCTLREMATGNSLGEDLYTRLKNYFQNHLTPIEQNAGSLQKELVRYYATEWDRYKCAANRIHCLFDYLNTNWIKRARKEGKTDVYPIKTLAVSRWRQKLFTPLQPALSETFLKLVAAQRKRTSIDQDRVMKVLDSFVSFGDDVYEKHFEERFLEETQRHYKALPNADGAEGSGSSSHSEYLKSVEAHLQEEEERVMGYLGAETRKKLDEVILRPHVPRIHRAFQPLLDSDADEDLKRLYKLLERITEGPKPLQYQFEKHVKDAGLGAIQELIGGSIKPTKNAWVEGKSTERDPEAGVKTAKDASNESESSKLDPKAYVDALLSVHGKNAATVAHCFKSDAGFTAALDKACKEFVNRNAWTAPNAARSPELLAEHADMLLRKSNKVAGEMVLFKYLEGQDVFQTYYTTRLSKRLIHGVCASDEAEASMISKLKEACGFEYTNKLQRMFTDVSLSKDLTNSFTERMAQNHDDIDIPFSVMVLGTNFWPLTPPTHDLLLPPELLPTFELFTREYQIKHDARKLTWLHNYSKTELQTNYTNQKYILKTSAYQAAVLLQYNRNDTLSLQELQEATKISADFLEQVLALLVKAKVLVNEEKDQYDLNPASLPTLWCSYYSNSLFKIMKARKRMKNQVLIQDVISQISQCLVPEITAIKQATETLLEKEYIERVNGSKDRFAYVA
ncbi:Cullin [Mycena olivaceomarginata]|nr:Cullin [Mycena olivaceomarginata]